MVTEEDLQALDYLIWCGNGRQTAELVGTNQSTISRRVHGVLATFHLSMKRQHGRLLLQGPHRDLLSLERRVHQGRRWLGVAPLRLEVEAPIWPWLQSLSVPPWILRSSPHLDPADKAELIAARILEAWIAPLPAPGADPLPNGPNAALRILPLSRSMVPMALALVVRNDQAEHPQIAALVATLQGMGWQSVDQEAAGLAATAS